MEINNVQYESQLNIQALHLYQECVFLFLLSV